MSKKVNVSDYKRSLRLKSVDELINIILRKDDKEKEKNKQIAQLERKIKHYKDYQKDSENEIKKINNIIKDKNSAINELRNDCNIIWKDKNKYLLQSKSLIFIVILEFIIILILAIMFHCAQL